jgi:hypothetical protein
MCSGPGPGKHFYRTKSLASNIVNYEFRKFNKYSLLKSLVTTIGYSRVSFSSGREQLDLLKSLVTIVGWSRVSFLSGCGQLLRLVPHNLIDFSPTLRPNLNTV